MISGRRTGMRALVQGLYIPLGPLVTAALIPSNIWAHNTWTAADSKWTTARLARSLGAPGWGRLQRVWRRRIRGKSVTYILSSMGDSPTHRKRKKIWKGKRKARLERSAREIDSRDGFTATEDDKSGGCRA